MKFKYLCQAALLLLFCGLSTATLSAQNNTSTYIKAGQVFNSEKAQLIGPQILKIDRNRITEMAPDLKIPADAKVIDLTDFTVLPGLIDGHTHLMTLETIGEDNSTTNKIMYEGDALRVLRGAKRAKSFLENGFTSIRDLGDSGEFLDVALKRAINEGTTDGPRMFVSGPIISAEGGQVVGMLKKHRHVIDEEYTIIKSVDEAIDAVRQHVTYGADLIKICANNTPNPISLTIEEMQAIVKMAHRYNRIVTAHATNDKAVWEATTAGVDGIEHGYQISDTTLQLMAEKGTVLVPTDISKDEFLFFLEKNDFQGDKEKAYNNYQSGMADRLMRAIKAGVTIVTGSDNYINFEKPQGDAAKEILIAYLEAGMKPMDILQSSTYLSAKFMGMEKRLGVLKAGALADIIAVKGDIENDFAETIFNIGFVMKNGTIYVEKN